MAPVKMWLDVSRLGLTKPDGTKCLLAYRGRQWASTGVSATTTAGGVRGITSHRHPGVQAIDSHAAALALDVG